MNPYDALRRIKELTGPLDAGWPGDIEAARLLGTISAIAFGALCHEPKPAKQETEQ